MKLIIVIIINMKGEETKLFENFIKNSILTILNARINLQNENNNLFLPFFNKNKKEEQKVNINNI
jgi:hypothetical protein